MKKTVITFVLLMFVAFSIYAQKTFVLITGVSNYYNPEIKNLNFTTKDCKDMKEIFDNQKNTSVAILTSKYVTKANIEEKLNAIIKLAKPEDKVIFYFSGHGYTGGIWLVGGEFYKYTELSATLNRCKANNVFCFIDACNSGSITKDIANNYDIDSNTRLTYMLACRAEENSAENGLVGNGLFTKALKKGLRGLADENADKKITLMELFKYVHADVAKHVQGKEETKRQHPQLIGPKSAHSAIITSW